MREILSDCDVFANCSREDTLSIINIEAQACGIPVVVYKNTGINETVCNGVTGFVVDEANYELFNDAIHKIKNNGSSSYKDNCRLWIERNFDESVNFLQVVGYFNEIIN